MTNEEFLALCKRHDDAAKISSELWDEIMRVECANCPHQAAEHDVEDPASAIGTFCAPQTHRCSCPGFAPHAGPVPE